MTTTTETTTTPDHTCTTCEQDTAKPGDCTICGGAAQALCNDCGRPVDYVDDQYVHLIDAERGCFLIPAVDGTAARTVAEANR